MIFDNVRFSNRPIWVKRFGTKDEHGNWFIEPAELHRVYPPADQRNDARNGATQHYASPPAAALDAQIAALRDTAELLRAQLKDVRKDRDHRCDQAQAVTRQLADLRPVAEPVKRPWWRRLAG